MPAIQAPTVRLRRLARELRQLRDSTGLTTKDVALRLGWSHSKMSRIETARTAPSATDVAAILDLYGTPTQQRAALLDLTRAARQRGWWTAYSDVFTGSYVALEDEASEIRDWEVQVFPGLLQTSAYMRAALRAGRPDAAPEDIEQRVRARMARQALLGRTDAPGLHAVLDEGVFRRAMVEADVMVGQVRALLDAPPNVSIQVMPFTTGFHSGLDGSFVILSFPEDIDSDVAYTEGIGGDLYVEGAEGVTRCNLAWERLTEEAMPTDETRPWLVTLIEEMER